MAVVKNLHNSSFSVYWSIAEYWERMKTGAQIFGYTDFKFMGHDVVYKLELKIESSEVTLLVGCQSPPTGYRPTINVMSNLNGIVKERQLPGSLLKSRFGFHVLRRFYYKISERNCSSSCPEKTFDEPAYFHLIIDLFPKVTLEIREVLRNVSNVFDSQSAADLIFVVQGERIKAHLIIINSASSKMAAILKDRAKVSRPDNGDHEKASRDGNVHLEREIFIDDVDPRVFRNLLSYIYTGTAPEIGKYAEQLYIAAHKFEIIDLKQLCYEHLLATIDLNSVCRFLILAHEYDASELIEASIDYLVKNKKDLWNRKEWKELMKNRPNIFFLVSHKMID